MSVIEPTAPHAFRNTAKLKDRSGDNWGAAEEQGLINLFLTSDAKGRLTNPDSAASFINMSSYSYLGLNSHPDVIQGAIAALESERVTGLGITPTRMKPALMRTVQTEMSELWNAQCLYTMSCSTATAGLLPLVSSGMLVDGKPRATVFDKRSHFCMDFMKPTCADEAPVFTSPHNDVEFLEDICKKYSRVAYIADGAYSMGGTAKLQELLRLQEKYGLFLWFDDSHAISVQGKKGEGFVRSHLPELNELTVITASLEKGFGCNGGVVMLSDSVKQSLINSLAGPLCWSQTPSIANLGSVLACTRLHATPELAQLQSDLKRNVEIFDAKIPSANSGSQLPLRALAVGDRDLAVKLSSQLLEEGFYTSPVYFPVSSKGREGLRIMIRSNVAVSDMKHYVDLLDKYVSPYLID